MAKRRRKWDSDAYQKSISKGRGLGSGAEYKPWVAVQDFASLGMVSRVKSQTTGRMHHLMSSLETRLFYILDWSDKVTDIREQYPLLDLADAIMIAENARIRYPYDRESGFPYVLTSDFYIDTLSGSEVVTVKPSAELLRPRVIEKLEIERRYWTARGIDWHIATEHEIDSVKAANIEWLAQSRDLGEYGLGIGLQDECKVFMTEVYPQYIGALDGLFVETEKRFGLEAGMGLTVYKHLAYHKQIHIDISTPLVWHKSQR